MTWEDAIEYILAGATAVGVGTVLFRDPWVVFDIIEGMSRYLEQKGLNRLDDIKGKVKITESDDKDMVSCHFPVEEPTEK